jgi:hypothetical protein
MTPGMVPWQQINVSAPFAQAFKTRGAMWMSVVVSFGGLAGEARASVDT